jgi:cytochrome c553
MHQQTEHLADKTIDAIARHYAGLSCIVGPTSSTPDMPLLANRCLVCHDAEIGGRAPLGLVPNLAGQRADYLVEQTRRLRASGTDADSQRGHPIMAFQGRALDDGEIDELALYFESLGCANR